MPFSGMRFELSYNNQECDVIHESLNPALKQAVEYDRVVGFFFYRTNGCIYWYRK